MWTLEQALVIIRLLQPKVYSMGWHLCLGGGVLNKGVSNKDLDLYTRADLPKRQDVVDYIQATLGASLEPLRPDMDDYEEELPFTQSGKLTLPTTNQRIDFFIQ